MVNGAFDHVLPPWPEPGEKNEFIGQRPVGLGPRVPMIVCSPWTRGGFVDSNTYDHTSVLRFLETWTGVPGGRQGQYSGNLARRRRRLLRRHHHHHRRRLLPALRGTDRLTAGPWRRGAGRPGRRRRWRSFA
jgi:hypothetical protein